MSTKTKAAVQPEAIVIGRDGTLVQMPQLTQEQRNALWEQVVRACAQRHPEIFRESTT